MEISKVQTFEEVFSWLTESNKSANVLLGNGFSMAFDSERFAYGALAGAAELSQKMPTVASNLMKSTGTVDFESLMRTLNAARDTLHALDPQKYAEAIGELNQSILQLREALVHAVAGLHPDRPFHIEEARYFNTRKFLDRFKSIYTVNYDLLLYWSLMKDFDGHPSKSMDDGFRQGEEQALDGTVKWNMLGDNGQTVYYLHGALHLYQARDGLHKITWKQTDTALMDQIREQLGSGRYPVFISEGDSIAKLDKINRNAYLSRSLRSLARCSLPLVVYGHSLDANDDHILNAIVASRVQKVAVSVFGNVASEANQALIERVDRLISDRAKLKGGKPLEIRYFDSETAEIWRSDSPVSGGFKRLFD